MGDMRHHISSAVVVTRPDLEDVLAEKLAGLEGVEVHARGAGKIVVVIEGPTAGHLGDVLVSISAMDGVIAAHMVFEQAVTENEEDVNDLAINPA